MYLLIIFYIENNNKTQKKHNQKNKQQTFQKKSRSWSIIFHHFRVMKIVTFKNRHTIPLYMTDNQETIKKIKLFGLNTYEAKIWVALLSRGVSTAGELSDIANVPRSRSYDVLESLEKKGFVVMKLGKPIKYLAVPPKEVLNNIKKQIIRKKEARLSGIKSPSFNNIINTFHELHKKNTQPSENLVAVLKGRKNIHKHMDFLFKTTERNAIFSTENKSGEYYKHIELIKNETKKGAVLCDTGFRLFIADDSNILIFPLSEKDVHPDYDLCIWIKHEHTTKLLKNLLISA